MVSALVSIFAASAGSSVSVMRPKRLRTVMLGWGAQGRKVSISWGASRNEGRDPSGGLARVMPKPGRLYAKPTIKRVQTATAIIVDCSPYSAGAAILGRP